MGFAELLELDLDRIRNEDKFGLKYCARAWQEAGEPGEPKQLVRFLDSQLERCVMLQVRYPKVLLLRLGQLRRGEWKPRAEAHP